VFDSQATAEKIRAILEREFQPLALEVEDQSHYHIGHKSAGGGGHFFVTIRSARFNGLQPLARQRLVIESMGEMMDREIHALSMRCLPE
jgi:BolA protein